jgi:hypothetical protein
MQNIIVLLIAIVALLLLLHACERRTTTGPGSGSTTNVPGSFSATNATADGVIVLHSAFTGLLPGRTVPVAFTADNIGKSSQRVGIITSVISIDARHRGCLAADFTAAPVAANRTIASHRSGVVLRAGSIAFADTTLNQDGCKGATVTLTSTSVDLPVAPAKSDF